MQWLDPPGNPPAQCSPEPPAISVAAREVIVRGSLFVPMYRLDLKTLGERLGPCAVAPHAVDEARHQRGLMETMACGALMSMAGGGDRESDQSCGDDDASTRYRRQKTAPPLARTRSDDHAPCKRGPARRHVSSNSGHREATLTSAIALVKRVSREGQHSTLRAGLPPRTTMAGLHRQRRAAARIEPETQRGARSTTTRRRRGRARSGSGRLSPRSRRRTSA